MSSVVYDDPDQLPAGTAEARLALAGLTYVIIDTDVVSDTGAAIKANETEYILIGKNRTVSGQTFGLDLTGHGSSLTNNGTIRSLSGTGAAIRLSGVETYSVNNTGTITAAGLAIEGSAGVDRIVNTGTLQTTANAILMDLKDGADFYNGIGGSATGGIIKLGLGNDTAYGGAGSEIFDGGAGNDYLNGGGGNDTVDYSEATGGVTVDLNKTTAQAIGSGQGIDTLCDIDNLVGGASDDRLTGNAADNMLDGGAGSDTLDGGTGNDSLKGGDGNDSLQGGAGNDTIEGGAGGDTLDGGAGDDSLVGGGGIDTVRYSGSAGVRADLSRSDGQITVGAGVDILIGITNLEGGSNADVFTGNAAGNRLVGNGGDDTLQGGGGNDTLEGGTGQDMAVFSGASTDYTRTDNPDGTVSFTDKQAGRDGTDTLKDVRLVKFSDKTVALTNASPTDISLSGTSLFEDKAVGSVLGSPRGTDPDGDALTFSLVSNPGGYFGLNGSGGLVLSRALDYETAAQHTITIKAEDKYGGILTETFTIAVRNVVETTPLVRSGTAGNEQVAGESGNDRLFGLGGNDVLFGQIGNDTLTGGTGSDTLVGGTGADVFVFDQKPNAKSNLDYIQDFSPTDDVVHLSRKIFSKIAKGALSSKAFVTGNKFKDKDDRVLYYKEGGALFYDPDGSGSAKAIQFANLSKGLKITHKDFFVI
jgi:Ca2+-binding RTX toxin-like protein